MEKYAGTEFSAIPIPTNRNGEIPYLGSLHWYAKLAESIACGSDAPRPEERDINSCTISGEQKLTIPVEGGRHALRSRALRNRAAISEHGRWRQVHLGAIKAAYGRTPYYSAYYPELERLILDSSEKSLHSFNSRLHSFIMKSLMPEASLRSLIAMRGADPGFHRALRAERMAMTDIDLSILDAMFRLGPDTIFLLLEPLNE